jgi:hypothetical protein
LLQPGVERGAAEPGPERGRERGVGKGVEDVGVGVGVEHAGPRGRGEAEEHAPLLQVEQDLAADDLGVAERDHRDGVGPDDEHRRAIRHVPGHVAEEVDTGEVGVVLEGRLCLEREGGEQGARGEADPQVEPCLGRGD